MVSYDILVKTQATPNPLAVKFVVNSPIKMVGKATFTEVSEAEGLKLAEDLFACLLYTSPSPRDRQKSRMPSSA